MTILEGVLDIEGNQRRTDPSVLHDDAWMDQESAPGGRPMNEAWERLRTLPLGKADKEGTAEHLALIEQALETEHKR